MTRIAVAGGVFVVVLASVAALLSRWGTGSNGAPTAHEASTSVVDSRGANAPPESTSLASQADAEKRRARDPARVSRASHAAGRALEEMFGAPGNAVIQTGQRAAPVPVDAPYAFTNEELTAPAGAPDDAATGPGAGASGFGDPLRPQSLLALPGGGAPSAAGAGAWPSVDAKTDFNGDGVVDASDYVNWHGAEPGAAPLTGENGDGSSGFLDALPGAQTGP